MTWNLHLPRLTFRVTLFYELNQPASTGPVPKCPKMAWLQKEIVLAGGPSSQATNQTPFRAGQLYPLLLTRGGGMSPRSPDSEEYQDTNLQATETSSRDRGSGSKALSAFSISFSVSRHDGPQRTWQSWAEPLCVQSPTTTPPPLWIHGTKFVLSQLGRPWGLGEGIRVECNPGLKWLSSRTLRYMYPLTNQLSTFPYSK